MATRVFRALFQEPKGSLEEVERSGEGFNDERSIQTMIGNNIKVVFPGYELVKQEFVLGGNRIDTVAFNAKTKSFMLIEYKKSRVADAVKQVMMYLVSLNEMWREFLYQCGNVSGKQYKKEDIEWGGNKGVIISPSFTKRDCYAAKASKYKIELHCIAKYENGIMTLERVDDQGVDDQTPLENLTPEEKNHFKKASDTTRSLYIDLKNEMRGVVSGLRVEPKKVVIKMLSKNGKGGCVIRVQHKSLKLYYLTNSLDINHEDRFFVRRMIDHRKQRSTMCVSKIEKSEDVSRAIHYVRQVYNEGGKRLRAYDEDEYLFTNGSDATKELYRELEGELIANIPDAKSKTTKRYIRWYTPNSSKSFCSVVVLKKSLILTYNTKQLNVPKTDVKFIEYMKKNGKKVSMAGLGEYRSKIISKEDITRAIPYVVRVHKKNVGRHLYA